MTKFIVSADFHLRADKPRCRIDEDWMAFQKLVLSNISDLSNSFNIPICIVGDIFNTATVPDHVKNLFIEFANNSYMIYGLAGNHCLPYHSWKNMNNSSFGVLWNSGVINSLKDIGIYYHFGEEAQGDDTGIVFYHQLVFPDIKSMPPNTKALVAQDMLDMFPDAKWICLGDYHRAFHYEKNGRHVINPGCITIQTADMKDYDPSIYIVDTDNETVEMVKLTNSKHNIVDDYLRTEEERETRISSFIESVRRADDIGFDFNANVEEGLKKNKFSKRTKDMISRLMEV